MKYSQLNNNNLTLQRIRDAQQVQPINDMIDQSEQ
jgi:hypothetical protein